MGGLKITAISGHIGASAHTVAGSGKWALAGLVVLVFSLDRVTKVAIVDWLPYGALVPVLDGFFNLVHARNTGIAFSMFSDSSPILTKMILPGISILSVIVILWVFYKYNSMSRSASVGLALIVAGALGNLYERLLFGYVVDFLDLYVSSYHWPAFNVADTAITVGAGLLILDSFRGAQKPVRTP